MYQKRKIRKEKRENSNQNEKFHKVVLNWLSCIYGDYHLNPYKMGIFKKWYLARFYQKTVKLPKKWSKYSNSDSIDNQIKKTDFYCKENKLEVIMKYDIELMKN